MVWSVAFDHLFRVLILKLKFNIKIKMNTVDKNLIWNRFKISTIIFWKNNIYSNNQIWVMLNFCFSKYLNHIDIIVLNLL